MMRNKFMYSLPVLVALTFSGCGSSDSSSAESSEDIISTGYKVVVERGPVLDANVTDANGSVAIQVSDTNNTYIFEDEPVYPITAEGGWIDVDGDGNLTTNDVALDINLTSYSDVITPTTTYCADENETLRQEKMEELASESNCTVDDLLSPPSEATKNSIVVLNAVYEKLMERKNSNSNAPIAIRAILDRYTEINNNTNLDENATSEEMAIAVEEQTMFNLQGKGLIKRLDNDDIEKIKGKKPKKLKDDNDSDEGSSEEDEESTETDDSLTDEKVTGSSNGNGNKPDKDTDEELVETDDNSTSAKVTGSNNGSNKGKGEKPNKQPKPNKK